MLRNMKKFFIFCSVLFGFAVTGLMADEAAVTPAASHSTVSAAGSHSKIAKRHHRRGHKHHHHHKQR